MFIVGIFSELITGATFNITQQFYAHRSLPNLIVVEVDLMRSNTHGLQSLLVELNQWTASYDLTFAKQLSSKEEVRWIVDDFVLDYLSTNVFLIVEE